MALSVTSKVIIAGFSSIALGGVAYGVHSQFSATISVKDALIKKSKTPLDLDSNAQEDLELIKELTKQHSSSKLIKKTKIEGLNLINYSDTGSFKAQCKKLLSVTSKEANFQKSLSEAESWCTRENAPRKISTLLEKRGRILLKDNEDDAWNEPWEKFKNKHTTNAPTGAWELVNWNSLNKSTVPKDFKIRCTANGGGSIMLDEQDYLKEIEDYCTKSSD